jgi:hypothetical protein
MAPSSVANILSAIVRLAREGPRYDTRREFPRIWLDALKRDFLSILYGRHLLIDRPCKLDVPLNPVNLSFFGFALGAAPPALAAIPGFVARGHGTLINISSVGHSRQTGSTAVTAAPKAICSSLCFLPRIDLWVKSHLRSGILDSSTRCLKPTFC